MMRSMMIAALLACTAVPAWAQAPTGMFSKLTVGCVGVPASTSTMRICGSNPTRSGGQAIVSVDGSGNTTLGALVAADIPSTFTQRNVAETIASPWTFSGGIAGPLNVTTSLSSPIGTFSTRARTPLVDTDSGPLTLQGASGVVQFGSNTTKVLPPSMQAALGELQAPWLSLDVLELRARRFIADETIAYTGGSGMWSRGTTLTRALTDSATTIYVKHNILRYLDFVVLRDLSTTGVPQYEVMRVTSPSGVPQPEGDYAYSVERNRDGTGANAWVEGQALVSTDRMINVYSYSPTRLSYWGSVLGDRPLLAFNFMTSPAVDLAGTGATATIGSGASHAATAAGGDSVPGMFYRTGSAGTLYSGIDPGTALNGVQGTCAISVELIVRIPDGGFSGAQAYITSKGAPGSSANHFAILHTGDGRFYMLGAPGGTWAALTPQTPVFSTAQYVHLVFTWDSSAGGRVFVNGVQSGGELAAPGGCLTPNATAIVGNGQWVTGQTTGAGISELAIYGYVLSPSQIRAHHEARNVGHTSLTNGPTITGEERTSTTDWHGIATRWAIGQLQGIADYVTPTMGFWAGDQSATWVSVDAANGFRIGHGSAIKLHAKANGDVDLGGNLNLVTGGDIRSPGNFSISAADGFVLQVGSSSSGFTDMRSIRWRDGGSIIANIGTWANQSLQIHSNAHGANAGVRISVANTLRGLMITSENDGTWESITNIVAQGRATTVGDDVLVQIAPFISALGGQSHSRLGTPAFPWSAVYATTYHAGATAGYTGTCAGNPVVSGGIVVGCS